MIPGEVYAWCGGYATSRDGVTIIEHDTYTEAAEAARLDLERIAA